MLLRALKSECLKCRRAPVWLVFLILPLFPAVLGTLNYLGNQEVLTDGWYSLWSQHTLFAATFFLPAQLGVFCAWQWRLEHSDHNWNSFRTAPVPLRDLYLAKLLLAAGVCLLAQAAIAALFLLGGGLAGLGSPEGGLLRAVGSWVVFGTVGGLAVCAVQLYLSLRLPAFAPPVALGLLGGIAGLLLTAQGWGMWFPYSLLCLGMRANNPNLPLETGPFLLACVGYILFFSLLSLRRMARRDVTTG